MERKERRQHRTEAGVELGVLAHAIAVGKDVHEVAVMQDSVDEDRGHDVVAKHLAPFLEALVRDQHRRGMFVAAIHKLEKRHCAVWVMGRYPI